jgi:hypothetical protein
VNTKNVVITDLTTIAVNVAQASKLTGISPDVIRRAIRANKLIAYYPSSRPIMLVSDLLAWITSSPSEPTSRRHA